VVEWLSDVVGMTRRTVKSPLVVNSNHVEYRHVLTDITVAPRAFGDETELVTGFAHCWFPWLRGSWWQGFDKFYDGLILVSGGRHPPYILV